MTYILPRYMHLLISTSYLPITYRLCKSCQKIQVHLVQYACWKKIHESWLQYVGLKSYSSQICCLKKSPYEGGGAMV
jgi:hypothetical protein